MKKRPTGHYKKYIFTLQGERHCTYYQQQGGELIVDSSTLGERTLCCS